MLMGTSPHVKGYFQYQEYCFRPPTFPLWELGEIGKSGFVLGAGDPHPTALCEWTVHSGGVGDSHKAYCRPSRGWRHVQDSYLGERKIDPASQPQPIHRTLAPVARWVLAVPQTVPPE